MDVELEEMYFKWLCAKVTTPYSNMYDGLLMILHKTEFVWIVLGDRNRAADGVELRTDFLRETNYLRTREWYECPCSILEALIAFARKANFQTDMPVADWFWKFIENLGLSEYRRVSDGDVRHILDILNTFVWRTYQPNGVGGLCPMAAPHRDQREVEIWYQWCEYVQEQRLI